MAFSLSVNAAEVLSFGIQLQPELGVVISYSLAQAPDGAQTLTNWAPLKLGGQDQQVVFLLGTAVPTFTDLATAIKADTEARFGGAVDAVLINGTAY